MNKSKNFIKTFVFAFAFLLTLALTLGISGAWYNTRRQADGVITMSDGIVIEYSGFGQGSGEWQNNSADFLLFVTNNEAGPGTTATLNAAGIKAGSGSADFFVRAKLEYKFFTDVDGLTEVTSQIADYSAFVNTPTFAQGWVDSNNGDGWFYYATGSTFNTLPSADYVNVFTPGQSITLNGDAEGFNHQGGGYKYSDEILIKRVTVVLTLEAYQANQTAAANAGWEIVPAYTDAAGVVYTQNLDGTWTLTNGQSINSSSSNTTATYAARVYDSSYSYTILSSINGQDVVAIGDAAFLNASQLTAVEIPTTVSTIGSRAFEGTGLNSITLPQSVEAVGTDALAANTLTEVTIENDQAVVTGIETAGIPTASVVNVPGVVYSGYETTLGVNYNVKNANLVVLTVIESNDSNKGQYMAEDSQATYYFNKNNGYYSLLDVGDIILTCVMLKDTNTIRVITLPDAITGINGSNEVEYIKACWTWYDCALFNDYALSCIGGVIFPESAVVIDCSSLTELTNCSYISFGSNIQRFINMDMIGGNSNIEIIIKSVNVPEGLVLSTWNYYNITLKVPSESIIEYQNQLLSNNNVSISEID